MKQPSNIVKQGGSIYLLIPPALVEYLHLRIGEDAVIIEDKEKSKGRFAAFWRIEDDKKMKDAKDSL